MNTPAHRRTIVHGDNADSMAIERTIGAHLPRSTGYRCSACDAQHGQPHAAGCPETSLAKAATIAADMLAELDSTKLPLAVPAAIGVLRTAVDAAASQVHPDSALPSRSDGVADTMDHAQLQALGEHHKTSAAQLAGSKTHGAPISAPAAGAAEGRPAAANAGGLTVADYEEVLASHRRLVRELDVLLNDTAGAAKQASLSDIVSQVRREGIRATAVGAGDLKPVVWGVTVGEDIANTFFLSIDKEEVEAEYAACVERGYESVYRLVSLCEVPAEADRPTAKGAAGQEGGGA